jgi:hypothetical protein
MYVALDVETKNLGSDIMKDNEQLLSLQLGDDTKQELYYYDSKEPKLSLAMGKKRIASLLSQGVIFTGYNIKRFDTVMLKEFLGIEIPESKLLDLCLSPRLTQFATKPKMRMEEACKACGVDVNHKRKIDKGADKFRAMQDIREQAKARATELVRIKSWSYPFSYNYVLDKIAGGHAIFEAYQEFVKSGGQKDTLFYEYAIGDVISEYQLLKKLGY